MVAPVVLGAALEIARIAGPGLVKWLSGSDKAAEAAGALVTVAQEVTGTGTPAEALAKLKADPNLVLQLQARSVEIDAGLEQAYLADRQDARKMAVEVVKAGGVDRKNAMILGDVVGLVVCLAVLVYVPELPGEVRGIISTIAGFFGLGLRDAHQFEFGSSRGSQDKTELLARR
jgi:hypothetical protein